MPTSPTSASDNDADIDFSLDAAAAIAATASAPEPAVADASDDPTTLAVRPMLELRLGDVSFESEPPAVAADGASKPASRAFGLRLEHVCAAVLPDADPAAWVEAASESAPEVDR
eukprot:5251869-Prymnesium_polylepis.1